MAEREVKPEQTVAHNVRLVARDIVAFTSRVLEPHGVNQSQADCLYFLIRGETSPSQIAQKIGLDPSNLSRIIREFEGRGWVRREVDDANRRRVLLSLTPEGVAAAGRIDPHAGEVDAALRSHLSERELATLLKILRKIERGMDDAEVDDSSGSAS